MIGWSLSKPFALPIGLLSDSATFLLPKYGNATLSETRVQINFPIESEVVLSMLPTSVGNGLIDWIDNGATFDEYQSKFGITVKDANEIDEIIQGVYFSEINELKTDSAGVMPMGVLFSYTGGVDVVLKQIQHSGRIDPYAEYKKYSVSISPKETAPNSSFEAGCDFITAWSLDSLSLPYPIEATHKNKTTLFGVGHNGSYSDITTTKREFGNTVAVKVQCSIKQARALINKLLTIRGSSFSVYQPNPMYLFGYQYPETVTARLASERVTCVQNSVQSVVVGFELIIIGIPN